MRQTCFLFAACILLGMAGPVLAQSKPDSSMGTPTQPAPAPATTTPAPATSTPEPAKAAPAKAAKPATQPGVPAEELKKLEMLKGNWNSKVTMNEGSGAPGSATGKSQYAWVFNGMHLEGDHSYTISGKPMKGRTTWGWDAEKQQYQLLWVNSMDSAAKTYYGTFPSESSLSFFTTYMADGKAVTEKITFTFADPNSYVFKVENDASGTMATVMEETATRGAANAKSTTAKKPASKPATTSTKKKTG